MMIGSYAAGSVTVALAGHDALVRRLSDRRSLLSLPVPAIDGLMARAGFFRVARSPPPQ